MGQKTYATIRIWKSTLDKLKQIAKITNRTVLATIDVLADKELAMMAPDKEQRKTK